MEKILTNKEIEFFNYDKYTSSDEQIIAYNKVEQRTLILTSFKYDYGFRYIQGIKSKHMFDFNTIGKCIPYKSKSIRETLAKAKVLGYDIIWFPSSLEMYMFILLYHDFENIHNKG